VPIQGFNKTEGHTRPQLPIEDNEFNRRKVERRSELQLSSVSQTKRLNATLHMRQAAVDIPVFDDIAINSCCVVGTLEVAELHDGVSSAYKARHKYGMPKTLTESAGDHFSECKNFIAYHPRNDLI
jgi:hypothetical protein